jgi:cell envelope opacity-associated protein A
MTDLAIRQSGQPEVGATQGEVKQPAGDLQDLGHSSPHIAVREAESVANPEQLSATPDVVAAAGGQLRKTPENVADTPGIAETPPPNPVVQSKAVQPQEIETNTTVTGTTTAAKKIIDGIEGTDDAGEVGDFEAALRNQ